MPKRKTMAVAITPTQRKFRGYLILDQKLRKKLKMANKNITSTSGKDLQSILCQKKPELPNIFSRVYQLDCLCNGTYIDESNKKTLIRCIEHPQNSVTGNWDSSGATETIRSAMDNSTGFTREQSPQYKTCTKKRCVKLLID